MLNGLAYLGFSRIEDIEKMGFREYQLRLEAFRIRQIEQERQLAVQAWFNNNVQATKGSAKHPKPKFNKFDEFFNAKSQIEEVRSYFEVGYEKSIDKKEDVGTVLANRIEEFKRLKKAGKIIPLKERRLSHD